MKITKKSPLTGKSNTMDLPVTAEKIRRWQEGSLLIQDAFPTLTADQREFLMTGYTPEDWNAMFPKQCGTCLYGEENIGGLLHCRQAASPFWDKTVSETTTCEHWDAA